MKTKRKKRTTKPYENTNECLKILQNNLHSFLVTAPLLACTLAQALYCLHALLLSPNLTCSLPYYSLALSHSLTHSLPSLAPSLPPFDSPTNANPN